MVKTRLQDLGTDGPPEGSALLCVSVSGCPRANATGTMGLKDPRLLPLRGREGLARVSCLVSSQPSAMEKLWPPLPDSYGG